MWAPSRTLGTFGGRVTRWSALAGAEPSTAPAFLKQQNVLTHSHFRRRRGAERVGTLRTPPPEGKNFDVKNAFCRGGLPKRPAIVEPAAQAFAEISKLRSGLARPSLIGWAILPKRVWQSYRIGRRVERGWIACHGEGGQSGSNAGWRQYWPPTWLAIRGSCITTKKRRTPN